MGYFLAEILVSLVAWRVGKLVLPKRESDPIFDSHTASRKRYLFFVDGAGARDDHFRRSGQGQEQQPGILLPGSRLPEDRPHGKGPGRTAAVAGGYAGGKSAGRRYATRFAKWVKKGLKKGEISPGPPAFGQPGRKKDCNDLSGD
jgi:hypothetical protein